MLIGYPICIKHYFNRLGIITQRLIGGIFLLFHLHSQHVHAIHHGTVKKYIADAKSNPLKMLLSQSLLLMNPYLPTSSLFLFLDLYSFLGESVCKKRIKYNVSFFTIAEIENEEDGDCFDNTFITVNYW